MLDDAGFFEQLESGVPEFEVKDFAFAGEEIVVDAEARHRFEMEADDGVSDDLRDFGFFASVFLDRFQRATAQMRGAGFVLFKKMGGLGVEVPAEVIEAGIHGEHFHADGSAPLHIEEADDYVGDLDAGVVDVVLHLDGISGMAEDAGHGVAEDGIANVADVGGFVGVDAGVLDDHFSRFFL